MQQRSAAGGQPSPYGFAGEEQDPSGLLYLRARTYNPATGRFLQTDPVLGTPNQPRTLHNYAYAFNNPVNYVDPSGQKPPGLGTSTYKRVDARQYRPQFEQARSYANEMAALDRDNAAARSRMYRNAGQIMPVGQSNSWARTRGIRPEQGFNSARSANTVTSMTRGSLDRYYASELSEGHRPKGCGPAKPNHKPSSLDYAFYIRNQARSTGKNIVENVQEFAEDPQGTLEDWGKDIKQRFKAQRAKMYDDFSSGRVFSAKHWKKELAPVALAASIGIGMLPVVGSLYDAYSVWLERDPLTGAPLSKAEKGLIVAGFVGLGFIDEAGDFGKGIIKGVSSVDEIADAAKSARYADDVADAAKGLGRADEVIDVAKNLDNLDEAIDVAKNLDNVDEALDVTRNLDELEDANLISRLDEATAPSTGKGTMKQGDELRESLTRNNKQGALTERLEKQRVNQRLEEVATNNAKPVKQGDKLRETFRAKPKRPGLNRESGTLGQRMKAAAAWRKNGADLNDPAVRNMINRGFGPIQGGSGALDDVIGNLDWRQQRWEELRKQFGIPENAQMKSIHDIDVWDNSRPANERIWLGTNAATGMFDRSGNKLPFDVRNPDQYMEHMGEGLRGYVGGSKDTEKFAVWAERQRERGHPIGDVLGGIAGEPAWRDLAHAQLTRKGNVVDSSKIKLEDGLPLMIDHVTENKGQIIFNLHEGIDAERTPMTWLELQHILSDEERLSRTIFVIDWHY